MLHPKPAAALGAPTPHPTTVESVEAFMLRVAQLEWMSCPLCHQGLFEIVEIIPPASKQRCLSLQGPPRDILPSNFALLGGQVFGSAGEAFVYTS